LIKKKEPDYKYNILLSRCDTNADAWSEAYNRILSLERELHGWQTTTYQLMNALNIDLTLDENGQVVIKPKMSERDIQFRDSLLLSSPLPTGGKK
jgi:hypothetical protein